MFSFSSPISLHFVSLPFAQQYSYIVWVIHDLIFNEMRGNKKSFSAAKNKINRNVKCYESHRRKTKTELQRPKTKMRKTLRHTKKKRIPIQFNDAISTFHPLKKRKDNPTLFAQSFKCIISTKSRKHSHSSLWQKYFLVGQKKWFWIVNEQSILMGLDTTFFIVAPRCFLGNNN